MITQNEELNPYEFQSFDAFPKGQMFPAGWDLSEMLSASASETHTSSTSEAS